MTLQVDEGIPYISNTLMLWGGRGGWGENGNGMLSLLILQVVSYGHYMSETLSAANSLLNVCSCYFLQFAHIKVNCPNLGHTLIPDTCQMP